MFEDRAVPARQLDQVDQIGNGGGDLARLAHRQQPVLVAADHQSGHTQPAQVDVLRAEFVDEDPRPGAPAGRRGGGEKVVDEIGDRRVGLRADGHHRDEAPAAWLRAAEHRSTAERLDQPAGGERPAAGQQARDTQQVDLLQQVPGGGVDQRDGIGAPADIVGVACGPGADRDPTHRVTGDDRALPRPQRGFQHRVQVGGQMIEAVAVAGREPAAAVTAVIERDDAIVPGQVVDLLMPHAQRAGDAVCQHDRVAVVRAEHLGVQPGAVRGTHRNSPARGQFRAA